MKLRRRKSKGRRSAFSSRARGAKAGNAKTDGAKGLSGGYSGALLSSESAPEEVGAQGNSFTLAFPVWFKAARDGSRDKRYKDNRLVWGNCTLWIDRFVVTCKDPVAMVRLVSDLRFRGENIPLCDIEFARYRALVDSAQAQARLTSIEAIYRHFSCKPAQFEAFTSDILRSYGYDAEVTAPTNDGGYDVVARKDGKTTIVECKCFEPSSHVGRPLIQKLVGANETVHADRMAFVTTGGYSAGALAYARQLGVRCIDGNRLLELWQAVKARSNGASDAACTASETGLLDASVPSVRIHPSQAWLTPEETLAFFPVDCR